MHEDKGTCIYCLKDSSNAKGSEHIIPDSLGYKDTLPKKKRCQIYLLSYSRLRLT